MANRNSLAVNRLEKFKTWLVADGWRSRQIIRR